ncbi:immunoglobulin-like domain-containing protein, partial [Pseudomonas sp. MYb115]|uniref:immunoglobulin-like domain-containing protein n=1 Tax=Pseudomonas sp. MYb115 TaxID=1848717 RepID=UPI000D4413DB
DDLTIKLSNGGTVTVKAGDTSAIYTAPVQGDDVYKDGGPLSVTIDSATVKDQAFEDLQLSKEPGVVQINDTVDTVTVSIAGNGDVFENANPTFTITLNQALKDDLTVKLSNGGSVTVKAGETSAIYTAPIQGDDVYKDGGPLSVTITEATVKDQVFEDLQLSKEPGVVQINDTTDTVTVSIAGNGPVFENANPTFTITLNQALKDDLTVKLSNGGTVTVKAGDTSAIYTAPIQGDDVYKDGGPLSVTITDASVPGKVFEDLQLSKEPGVVQINDTTDTVTVSIAGNGDVFENANPTFTVSINQALKDDLTVKLSNGGTVTVKAGDTSAIYTAPIQGDDVYKDGGPLSVTIDSATVKDQVFEDLQLSKEPGVVQINDTTDTVTVSIAGNGPVFENVNPTFTVSINRALADDLTVKLSNGGTVTVKAGDTSAIYTAPVQGDDVYKDGGPLSVTIDSATVKDQVFEDLQLSKEPG